MCHLCITSGSRSAVGRRAMMAGGLGGNGQRPHTVPQRAVAQTADPVNSERMGDPTNRLTPSFPTNFGAPAFPVEDVSS